jgi:hypothetical protein
MKKILVPVSEEIKRKLDVKRAEGYTINGFVRRVLQEALANVKVPRPRRAA